MKQITLACACLLTATLTAQEPSTPAPADGLLIPSLTDEQMHRTVAKGQGELVYNRTERAFYVFNGEDWERLLKAEQGEDGKGIHWVVQRAEGGGGAPKTTSGTTGNWDLTGNSATDPAINFLGTTDGQPLRFRVGNVHAGYLSTSPFGTVALGRSTGASTDALSQNTFIGGRAGTAITTGFGNTCLGSNAGSSTTTFIYSTYVGANCGPSSNASGNAFFGAESGLSNTGGIGNTFLGKSAGMSNTMGMTNTMIGLYAGNGNTTGSDNVFVGSSAGAGTTTGNSNVIIGSYGGSTNITGSNNTSLGTGAGFGSSGLNNATAIGAGAQVGIDNAIVLGTASTSVGIGTSAPLDRLHVVGNIRMVDGTEGPGKVLTSDINGKATWQELGASSSWGLFGNAGTNPATNFIGTTDAQSLRFRANNAAAGILSNTVTGTVAFGLNTGVGSGFDNTFIGAECGMNATTGLANVFLGRSAGKNNTTASQNTVLGSNAGLNTTTGNGNVFVGAQSGNSNVAGMENVHVGLAAGSSATGNGNTLIGSLASATTTTGGNNVFAGHMSGWNNTTGSGNVAIGRATAFGSGELTNATAIGHQARVDASNAVVLGSVNGVNGATATASVGIGTSAPLDRLHVVGNIRMVDGTEGLGKVLTSNAAGTGTWAALPTESADWKLTGNSGTNPATNFIGTTDAQDFRIRTSNATRVSVTADGKVGLGISAPAVNLQVRGGLALMSVPNMLTGGANTITVGDRTMITFTTMSAGTTIALSDGLVIGQVLILLNHGAGTPFLSASIADGAASNCNLVANRTLGLKDMLTLIWDGGDWIEQAFSNN